jgi:hypothetical protein
MNFSPFRPIGANNGRIGCYARWDNPMVTWMSSKDPESYGGETYRGFHWKQEFLRVGATSKVDYDRLLNYRILPAMDQPVLKNTDAWLRRIRDMSEAQLKAIGEQEPDWPNTVKLDLIGQFTEPALSGATISTVMGLQRVMSPFDFKNGMVCVISVNHRWRTHGRLFRLILERLNPSLAAFETADGGPAAVMRLRNLHRFLPYWMGVSEKLAWAAGRRLLGKSPWRKTDRGTQGSGYPLAQWRRDTLFQLVDPTLLTVPKMRSAALYDTGSLQTFLSEAVQDSFRHEALLSRILTVEMALRLVGASV